MDATRSLAALARGFSERGHEAALLVERPAIAHTMGACGPLDVAYLDKDRVVLATRCLQRRRISLPCRGARSVLMVPAGAFSRWTLRPGDRLELRG